MLKVISSHVFLKNRLHPGQLEAFERAGAEGVEIFAARQHFDYTDRSAVRDIADWFRSSAVKPFSMHAPLYADSEMGRGGGPGVNVLHSEKSRRIDSMDEIKRALETAEQIPFRYLVIHLGDRDDAWSPWALEHSMTAIEHLKAYASPLGVQLLIENIANEVTAPERIVEILRVGHFSTVGVVLDVGHANFLAGVAPALAELAPYIKSSHLHDNQGQKDEHLWPGDGTVKWDETFAGLLAAPHKPAGVLEIHYALGDSTEQIVDKAKRAFAKFDSPAEGVK